MLPPALRSRPDITPDLAFYLEAFFFLSGFRSYSMGGPSPIPLSAISEYARLIGYTSSDDILFLAEVVNACDRVYLLKSSEQNASLLPQKPPPRPTSKAR